MELKKNSMFQPIRHSGFALFQVLLVAAICSVLVLGFGAYAKKQLKTAQLVNDRVDALVQLQTVQSLVELRLLTNADPLSAMPSWNIFSKPFFYENVEVRVQDLSGLYSITPFGTGRLVPLFQYLGADLPQANLMVKNLKDWQTKASIDSAKENFRHAPLQTLAELKFIPGFSESLIKKLHPFVTLYPTPYFSPMTAPHDLLAVFLDDNAKARQITELREANQLNQNMFWRLTSIDTSDTLSYSFGPGYRVELTYNGENLRYKKRFEATFSPYDKNPLSYWQKQRIAVDAQM